MPDLTTRHLGALHALVLHPYRGQGQRPNFKPLSAGAGPAILWSMAKNLDKRGLVEITEIVQPRGLPRLWRLGLTDAGREQIRSER